MVAQLIEAFTEEVGDQQRCRESLGWISRSQATMLLSDDFLDGQSSPF